MPLRQYPFQKCWSTFELPIPRYLAPRVFEPWPRALRRIHVGVPALGNQPTTSPDHDIVCKTAQDHSPPRMSQFKGSAAHNYKSRASNFPMPFSRKQSNRLEYRWQQLVLWLNKFTTYQIEGKNKKLWPRNSRIYGPRISDDEVHKILKDVAEDSLEWEGRGINVGNQLWLELMAKVLYRYPNDALAVLVATTGKTHEFQGLPRAAVADIVHCIAIHHLPKAVEIKSSQLSEVAIRIFRFQLDLPSSFSAPWSNHSIFLLLSYLPGEFMKGLYFYLSQTQFYMSIWTRMQFASKLAKFGETDLAFEAVQQLTKSHCRINSPNTMSVCTSLLHEAHLNKNAVNSIEDIFTFLVDSGMVPNIYTYNVLMHYTTQIPEPQAAWELHDDMIKSGIEPDVVTYSILLKDAKLRLDSTDMKRVMDLIRKRGINSKYILTDVLHAIFLLREEEISTYNKSSKEFNKKPEPALDQMLKFYAEHFDVKPLMHIIPGLSSVYHPPSNLNPEHDPWFPPPATLCVMITGFLSIVNSHGAKEFYDHFQSLVQAGDYYVSSLTFTTYVYNAILMCFYRFEERAKEAPRVLADMILPNEKPPDPKPDVAPKSPNNSCTHLSEASAPRVRRNRPHTPPMPDLYTWSILIKIMMRLKNARAAERIVNMMSLRNVEPTKVTWTSLIAGYARMQNPRMTADSFMRLEKAGYLPDDHVFRAMAIIHDQDKLVREIDRLQARKFKSVPSELLNELN